MISKRILVAVCIFPVLLLGCVQDEQQHLPETQPAIDETFGDHGTAIDEYTAAQEIYQLPEGKEYPPPPFTDQTGVYQTGFGTVDAVIFWNCSWGKNICYSVEWMRRQLATR